MSFSINTNVTSLQAQNYLNQSSMFQSQTINEVTSGLRIVNSGDDAAGLAIANGLRSDQAVLTQGIRNANDGLSVLQTVDGGMNNISNLLDRAATLATQSASSTFTGDRGVLNNEFQSVLTEINRQAQAVGLNQGGQFAKALSVFIGGGTASGSINAISNGSVGVDLTHATVDTQSLGLSGYSVTGNSSVDIGTGGGTTTVSNLLANVSNQTSETQSGFTTLYFTGSGFSNTSGTGRVAVNVNLAGVTDANSLVTAINAGIQSAGNGNSQQSTAFKNAGITASVYSDTSGASHLQFTSSNAAFQVEAGDQMSNAFLGNIQTTGSPTPGQGQSVYTETATTNATAMLATSANAGAESVKLQITNGVSTTPITLAIGATEARGTTLTNLNTALAGTGVTASLDSGNKLQFTSGEGQSLQVQVSGDASNVLGLGTFATGTAGAASYTSITAGAAISATATDTQNFDVAIGSQVASFNGLIVGASEATALSALNTAFQSNSLTRAANLSAVDNGGDIEIVSGNNTSFRLNAYGSTTAASFGFTDGVTSGNVATLTASAMNSTGAPSLDAKGTSTSGFLGFTGMSVGNSSQTVSLAAPDATGANHTISFSLSSANAGNIDAALSYINTQLLQSNDSTLQNIVAVKDQLAGADGISFMSSLGHFSVSLGTTSVPAGLLSAGGGNVQGLYTTSGTGPTAATVQGGAVITSSQNGDGATADVSSQQNAKNAVTALTNAVSMLGVSQAAVGKGENNFNYAINLAQGQVTNEAAAESRIRDADLAAEAANLSKAQILVQAGTAALAQANSAPQAVLSLLRG
ncbi:putative Flagellin domain protein [Candidatus Sulfopaludibacter sp. SbA3]|nr:putative Flagellin domain protein [Candidatus Sulfopaludibacter sp. SbA3]